MLSSRLVRSFSLLKPRVSCVSNISIERGISKWRRNVMLTMKGRESDVDLIPHKKRHRREWVDWNYDCEVFAFGKRLGEDFPMDKLKEVFIDQSYVDGENKKKKELNLEDVGVELQSNSKLTLKGDRIMREFITSYLRLFLPRVPEEGISSIVQNLCSEKSLSHIGGYIGCTELIMSSLVDPTDDMVANALKSVIAVLEETSGLQRCQKFIIDIVVPSLSDKDLLEIWDPIDPQTKVRKILKNDGYPDFEARLLRETGRNTIFSCYIVGLYVNKHLIGYGPGETVEIAQEMATYDSLRRFFHLTPSKVQFKFGPSAYNLDYQSRYNQINPPLQEWKLSLFNETINHQSIGNSNSNSNQQENLQNHQHQTSTHKIAAIN